MSNREITVNLEASKHDDHISVGLTIINRDGDGSADDDSKPTTINFSEDDETLNSKESTKPTILRVDNKEDEQGEETSILNIVDENDESKPSLGVVNNVKENESSSIISRKLYEKSVRTPRFEELTIEEEEEHTSRHEKNGPTTPSINDQSNETSMSPDTKQDDSEFTLISIPSKILNFFEKLVISNKGRIEMMKSLGNLMYLGSKTRTDVDVESETSDTLALLNDIYETEKISTVISIIGWYQDYVADKHKLQNKRIQSDPRFSSYHKAGQYLRLLECFILLVEIIFKKRSTYGENGKKNYWNLLIMTEIIKAIIKLLATSKSKTNTPLFLNYNVLPSDEQTMNIPMASFLPSIPKFSPFDKEANSLEKFANNYKKQAKPKVGSRSGRQIPSSDQLMAILNSGSDDVPTTSELGEQLGLNTGSEKFVLLAPQTEELKGSLGKMLMYIADTLYSIRPVVYCK